MVGGLVVLASLGMLASTLGLWARRVVLDTGTFTDTVTQTLYQREVGQAISSYLADQALAVADSVLRLAETLPLPDPTLAREAKAYVGEALSRRGAVAQAVYDVLATQRFEDLLVEAVDVTHRAFLRVLHGGVIADTDGVLEAGGDTVRLNLLSVLGLVLQEMQNRALIPAAVPLPRLTSGDPQAQIAALEAFSGVDLPPGFGQLTVYQGDTLSRTDTAVARARDLIGLFQRAVSLIVAVTVFLAAAAVVASPNRLRTVGWLGLGLFLVMVIADVAIDVGRHRVPGVIANAEARVAARVMVVRFSRSLLELTRVLAFVGAGTAGAALLVGRLARRRAPAR